MSFNVMEQPEDRLPVQDSSGYQDDRSKNIIVCGILSYDGRDPHHKKRFKRDCYELQSALRIGATNGEHITIVEKDQVPSAFIQHLLRWENEIFASAAQPDVQEYACASPHETTYKIVQHIFWYFKRINAYSNICRRLAAQNRPKNLSDEDKLRIYDILCCVEQRWRCVCKDDEIGDMKAKLLSALTSLWTPIIDNFAESSGKRNRKVLHRIIGKLQHDERQRISERHPFNENTKMDADRYFEDWVYSRGISLTGDKVLETLMPYLQDDLKAAFGVVSTVVIKSAVNKLRRLGDRTFWFHFSGHHGNDGIQCSDETIPSLQDILQSAGYVLSNIVVTIDCCYADTLVNNFCFAVDSAVEYSGLAVISSGSSKYRPIINSCFTPFLVMALCSASFTCLRPANNPCRDNCLQPEADCHVCKSFSEKCKDKGTISITTVFRCIKDHFQPSRKPTIRRHYARSQLPVARFDNSNIGYSIIFVSTSVCDNCCNLNLKLRGRKTFSMKNVRKMAFLRLLQLSHTTCMKHCEAIMEAKTLACSLYNYLDPSCDEECQKQGRVGSCNCVTLVQGMLEDSLSSNQQNFAIRDFNKPTLEFKRISMLRFAMTFVKQKGSSTEREIITNNEQFMVALSDGILLEVNAADITGK